MTELDDSELHLDRIGALAAAAGLAIDDYLQAAVAAQARRNQRRPSPSSLYARIQYAGVGSGGWSTSCTRACWPIRR
jgi:hypothetical protein